MIGVTSRVASFVSPVRHLLVGSWMAGMMAIAIMTEGAAASTPGAACALGTRDPLSLYGDRMRFQVLRDGTPIGHHEVRFRSGQDEVIAESRFEVEVKLLFFTAYRYQYHSKDVWRDGCLVALRAETNDNGKRSRVEAELEGNALRVTSEAGSRMVDLGIYPTTHWNPGVLGANRVLNTITGRVAAVDLVAMGEERVMMEGRPVTAQRYRYTGDLQTDVWYDAEGRWVKMRFNAEDGSTIEYVCERCGGRPGRA